MTFVFRDSYQVPQLHGYCGDTYITEFVPNKPLYEPLKKRSAFQRVFMRSSTWLWPSWEHRVKLSLGLLEFAMDAYQHGDDGTFYLCNISENLIGYTKHFEVKLLDLSFVLPKEEFGKRMSQLKCSADSDCVFSEQCVAKCDTNRSVCSGELVKPSFYYMCQIVKPFILSGMPKAILGDMLNLFQRCSELEFSLTDLDLKHSLVYTDMKTLLWRQISNSIP